MVFKKLADAAFGRNMTVTIDRAAMDRMMETLGQSLPERDGEQMALLGVRKGGNGDHIAVLSPVPTHHATSHLVSVNHDVLNGFVRHTLEPQGMAVGGMMHTQPANDSKLSPDDISGARGFMQGFRNFYKGQTPNYFLAPIMHFDRNRNPQVTTWVFDARHPERDPFKANMDVTGANGARMEANNYIRMSQQDKRGLDQVFGAPGQAC
ncbi:MAG: hypothetical protein JKY71_08140 [Alphaproteobacteria bacterium]|nr:hypothetical protein [Alphaproteobacteria bacterium]